MSSALPFRRDSSIYFAHLFSIFVKLMASYLAPTKHNDMISNVIFQQHNRLINAVVKFILDHGTLQVLYILTNV